VGRRGVHDSAVHQIDGPPVTSISWGFFSR
jgi:hypothetical protein